MHQRRYSSRREWVTRRSGRAVIASLRFGGASLRMRWGALRRGAWERQPPINRHGASTNSAAAMARRVCATGGSLRPTMLAFSDGL